MIDIHCHILPDYDDGASDLETAVEMARMAYRSGVTQIAATPHFPGETRQLEYLQSMGRRFRQLSEALVKEQIPLRLHPGAEILGLPETPHLAETHRLPTLGSGNYVLTEFYFDESYAYMDQLLTEISACGYRIVVAHPERYGVIQHDPYLLKRWARQGFVLQLNKGSVLGDFGIMAEQAANEILSLGLAHLIATDAHGCHRRTPHISALKSWVEEQCDQEYAAILLERNPKRVLEGRPMVGGD